MDEKQLAEYMRQYRDTGNVCRVGFELGGPVEDDYAFLIRPDDPDPPRFDD